VRVLRDGALVLATQREPKRDLVRRTKASPRRDVPREGLDFTAAEPQGSMGALLMGIQQDN